MSRIGNRTLNIPESVTITLDGTLLTVKGPKGELTLNVDNNLNIVIEGNELKVTRNSEIKTVKQMHGTTNALISNMIIGVTEGYAKSLEIIGVGYRFNPKGKVLEVSAGYAHKVELEVPEGLTVEAVSATEIKISGINKEAVGKFAAEIREVRKPEPYKGKGIRYKGEVVRRKEGKKASK